VIPCKANLVGVFTKEPMQVARFLQSQAPLSWGGDHVLPRVSKLDGNQLKNIKLIIDLDTMAEWIRNHCPGDFDYPDWFSDEANPHFSQDIGASGLRTGRSCLVRTT
jgi:hypothetical protein